MGSGLHGALPTPVLLLFLLGYCLAVIDGELRCYCNESGCVSTGYMCKSSIGICFTSIEAGGETETDDARPHTTHGCLDSVPPRHRIACTATSRPSSSSSLSSSSSVGSGVVSVNVNTASSEAARSLLASSRSAAAAHNKQNHHDLPTLLCCSEHMCNYVDDKAGEANSQNHPSKKGNDTLLQGSSNTKNDKAVSRNQGSSRDDDRDLWFKAAVIAVPIAGGFILVLLVLLAVRMLRTDSRHHRRLIQIRQDRNFTKTQMYISEHFVGKKHQCSLFNEKTGKICSILYPPPASSSSSSTCVNSSKSVVPKPIYTSTAHKNPSHRHAYEGLSGEGKSKIYNKRNIKLKDSCKSSSTTSKTKSPTSAISSSCDNFSSSSSSCCSKNGDSGCCKDRCGKTNSNFSINSHSSVCSGHHRASISSQESLHSKEKVFHGNDT